LKQEAVYETQEGKFMTDQSAELSLRAKTLGLLIREARLASGKTIEECARATGVSNESYEQFEAGAFAPSMPELEAIAYSLDFPLELFWESRLAKPGLGGPRRQPDMNRLMAVRHRMIGAQLRQARLENKLSLETLAHRAGLEVEQLQAYEMGAQPVPVTLLEQLCGLLSRSIREFQDRHGPIGLWDAQQRAIRDFLALSPEMQIFVSKPVNQPYLELAVRLSEMSVDRLRAVAEGLLEITY
jgi:transcriptional regulator with XRE-family HTH domain